MHRSFFFVLCVFPASFGKSISHCKNKVKDFCDFCKINRKSTLFNTVRALSESVKIDHNSNRQNRGRNTGFFSSRWEQERRRSHAFSRALIHSLLRRSSKAKSVQAFPSLHQSEPEALVCPHEEQRQTSGGRAARGKRIRAILYICSRKYFTFFSFGITVRIFRQTQRRSIRVGRSISPSPCLHLRAYSLYKIAA